MRDACGEKGFGLIELVVVIGMTATIALAVAGLASATLRAGTEDRGRQVALGLAEEAMEASVNLARDRWAALPASGTYHPEVEAATGTWTLASGPETVSLNGTAYVRTVALADVQRASTSNGRAVGPIVTSGGFADVGTRLATVTVSWPNASGTTNAVVLREYLARWSARSWSQTSWAGGAGQAAWSDPTRYSSDNGGVQLAGAALQLKGTSSTGGAPASGVTTNAGFDAGTSGWTFVPWGATTGATGSHVTSGGNPGGHARIRIQDRNAGAGGYWYQPIAVTAATVSTAVANLDWSVIRHDGGTTAMRLYVFLDATADAPVIGQQVWSSGVLGSVTPWASASGINVSSRITGPGTYYLKVGLYGTFGNQGPDVRVGIDNASMSWTGVTSGVTGTTYATLGTVESSTFDAGAAAEYATFSSAQSTPPGTSVRFQVSTSVDGTSWSFVGPDGTATTEFAIPSGELVNVVLDGRRYVRYRAYLRTTDVAQTPTLTGVRIEYLP